MGRGDGKTLTTTFPHSQRQRIWIQALVLSLCAVGLNLLRIDVVFGFDLLLGSSLAVFALLLLGDIGLVVGISASLIAWKTWGQPWCGLTMLADLQAGVTLTAADFIFV